MALQALLARPAVQLLVSVISIFSTKKNKEQKLKDVVESVTDTVKAVKTGPVSSTLSLLPASALSVTYVNPEMIPETLQPYALAINWILGGIFLLLVTHGPQKVRINSDSNS